LVRFYTILFSTLLVTIIGAVARNLIHSRIPSLRATATRATTIIAKAQTGVPPVSSGSLAARRSTIRVARATFRPVRFAPRAVRRTARRAFRIAFRPARRILRAARRPIRRD